MPKARNPDYTENLQRQSGELAKLGYYHSIELPDGRVIPGIQSLETQRARIAQFPIPEDLRGKRVLDIGAWDGWFSFEMERRGARVVAVDSTKRTRFLEAKQMLGSKVEHVVADISYLTPREVGYFDIVLFFGVLYHLKHPMLALERVCELSTDLVCVESFVTDDQPTGTIPSMEFYEGSELAGQFDNWVGPNVACLMAFCRTAGFARVEFHGVWEDRAHLTCYRKWPEIERGGTAPQLVSIENSWSRDHNFSATHDDYMTVWFTCGESGLDCDNTQVQVGPFGSRPVNVQSAGGNKWQIDCKLPPGLTRGWHDVRISARGSRWSAPSRIPVDLSRSDRRATTGVDRTDLRIAKVVDGRPTIPAACEPA